MLSAEASLEEQVLEHIAEIGAGRCSITDASIEAEPDPSAQQILAGLLMLHEDLQYAQQRHSALLEELRAAIRARDEFLSVASHELRTPITTLTLQIDGLSRMLHEQLPPTLAEKVARRLDVTRRQVDRLAGLVSALIDVSRITSGRVQLSRQLADLVEVSRGRRRSGWATTRRAAARSISFERQGPVWGNYDVSRVDQVMTNLLSNAIRYGRGKPIVLGVAAARDNARFWIEDQGIGIPPEHQARIFQQYERAAPVHQLRRVWGWVSGSPGSSSRRWAARSPSAARWTWDPSFTVEIPRAG